jgi:hypothetical protein
MKAAIHLPNHCVPAEILSPERSIIHQVESNATATGSHAGRNGDAAAPELQENQSRFVIASWQQPCSSCDRHEQNKTSNS